MQSQKVYISLLVFSFLSFFWLLLPYYRFQLNPDGVANMAIAEQLVRGDLSNAVNAYWSPLLPVCIAFWKILVGDFLLAAKCVNATCGIYIIIQCYNILNKLRINLSTLMLILLVLAIVVLRVSLTILTADLLFLAILFSVLHFLLFTEEPNRLKTKFLLGVLGGMLYVTKSYGLPFFSGVILISAFSDLFLYKKNIVSVFNRYASILFVFLSISVIWISILYKKYNFLTMGTSGAYNAQIISFVAPGQVMNKSLLVPPSFAYNHSIWDDISCIKFNQTLSPLNAPFNLQYLGLVIKNIFKAVAYSLFFFSLPIIFLKKRKLFSSDYSWILYFIFISIIQILSYSLLAVEERYFLFSACLNFFLFIFFLNEVFSKRKFIKRFFLLVTVLILVYQQFLVLKSARNSGKELYSEAKTIEKYIRQARFASINDWETGYYLSFLTNSKYYGNFEDTVDKIDILYQINIYDIDYIVFWNKPNNHISFKNDSSLIETYKNRRFTLYKNKKSL